MKAEFYSIDELPEGLAAWWDDAIRVQDPASCLVRGLPWFTMMAGASLRDRQPAHPPTGRPEESREEAIVAVLQNDKGSCRALLPLLSGETTVVAGIAGKVISRKPMKIMRVCGGDFVGTEATEGDKAELLEKMFERYEDVEAVWFNRVRIQAPTFQFPMSNVRCPSGFFMHAVSKGMPHYRIKLPATVEECLEVRSAKSVKKIRGRERALGRDVGECSVAEICEEKDWHPYAQQIEGLMRSTWQAERFGHVVGVEDMKRVAENGWLRSFLLLAGDAAVAFAFGFQGMGTFVYEIIGYDREFAKYSPGTILLYRLLEKLYEGNRPEYVDFGEGEADYKRLLANDVVQVGSFFAVRNRPDLGRVFRLKGFCDGLNRVGKRLVKR